jgi:hypothetical protein
MPEIGIEDVLIEVDRRATTRAVSRPQTSSSAWAKTSGCPQPTLRRRHRLAISDVVATAPLSAELAESVAAMTGCLTGAASVESFRALLADAGFRDIELQVRSDCAGIIGGCMPGAEDYVASATIGAVKPAASCCAPSRCATSEPAA